MKITAINGSHRGRRGYTQFLIDKFFEGAADEGAECETVVLADHKINQCTGCRICHTRRSYLKCIYDKKDDVTAIFDKMRSADIIIYATPIYIFTMTGLLKNFLDRITSTADSAKLTVSESGLFFHHIDRQLLSKPFVVLTCQDNFEDETCRNVVSYFKTFSNFHDAPLIGVLTRKSGSLSGQGKDKEKEAEYPKILSVYKAIIQSGREVVVNGHISAGTQKKANQNIIKLPKVLEFILGFRLIRKNKPFMNKIFENAVKNMKSSHD
jgi:multimeric flavodoxin WrbA